MMVVTNNRTDKGMKRMEVEKLVINFLFLFFQRFFSVYHTYALMIAHPFLREAQINSNSVVRIYFTWENYINK